MVPLLPQAYHSSSSSGLLVCLGVGWGCRTGSSQQQQQASMVRMVLQQLQLDCQHQAAAAVHPPMVPLRWVGRVGC